MQLYDSMVNHVWQMLLATLIMFGPLPILAWVRPHLSRLSSTERATAYFVLWSAVQAVVGQLMGHLGWLKLEYVLAVYLIPYLWVFGIAKLDIDAFVGE